MMRSCQLAIADTRAVHHSLLAGGQAPCTNPCSMYSHRQFHDQFTEGMARNRRCPFLHHALVFNEFLKS